MQQEEWEEREMEEPASGSGVAGYREEWQLEDWILLGVTLGCEEVEAANQKACMSGRSPRLAAAAAHDRLAFNTPKTIPCLTTYPPIAPPFHPLCGLVPGLGIFAAEIKYPLQPPPTLIMTAWPSSGWPVSATAASTSSTRANSTYARPRDFLLLLSVMSRMSTTRPTCREATEKAEMGKSRSGGGEGVLGCKGMARRGKTYL